MKELGYDVEYYLWVGIFAPKGTPSAIVSTLGAAIEKAAATDQFKTAIANLGQEVGYLNAADFTKFWDADAKLADEAVQSDRQAVTRRCRRAEHDSARRSRRRRAPSLSLGAAVIALSGDLPIGRPVDARRGLPADAHRRPDDRAGRRVCMLRARDGEPLASLVAGAICAARRPGRR